jgi:hypothetical protein
MSASGNYGPTRVAAGIVGYADLTLGDQVEPVLLAHLRAGGGRFRGVRHSAGWDESPVIGNSRPDMRPHLYQRPDFRAGLKRLSALGLSFDVWVYHPQLADVVELARAFPAAPIIMGHVGGTLGYGPYAGRRDEVFADWKRSMSELARCPNVVVKLGGMVNRGAAYDFHSAAVPPSSEAMARGMAAPCRNLHRAVRPQALHVRKQLPGRQDGDRLQGAVERLQAHRGRRFARRETRAVLRHRGARLPARRSRMSGIGHFGFLGLNISGTLPT